MTRRKIAVIGGGISGLTAGYILSRTDEVTLFEAASRLGGHADTHLVDEPGGAAGSGRHRVHRLQRAHLPAADPAAARARRGDAGLGDEHVGQLLRLRPAVRRQTRPGRRQRGPAAGRLAVPAGARRSPAVPPGRPAAAGVGAVRQGAARRPPTRRLPARRRLFRVLHRAFRRAAGRGRLVLPAGPGAALPGRLPVRVPRQPRHALGHRVTAVADRSRRVAELRRADRRPGWRRCACRPRCARCAATPTASRCAKPPERRPASTRR